MPSTNLTTSYYFLLPQVKYLTNRAATYQKLGALPEATKDANAAIKLDPTFVKGYTRRAYCEFRMKEFHKCLETYDQVLKIDPNNKEAEAGIQDTIKAISAQQSGSSNETEEERNKRAQQAMQQDPELQQIMTDPGFQAILKNCQEKPGALQEYMKDPGMAKKFNKLIAAGVLRTG